MGRQARKRSEPHLPPVQKIELSSAHSRGRAIAAIILLAVGVAALVYAFMGLFSAEEGWQEIEVSSSADVNCGGDFVLLYDLGRAGVGASAEKKALTAVWSDAAVSAYRLFSADSGFDDLHNVFYINAHPNEEIAVDPALYRALEQIRQSGDRTVYLGPVYELYDDLFYCEDDVQTADFDPRQNGDLRDYFARCAAFARDPASVDVQLLGEDRIRLNVSEEYLAFAEREEIGGFLDFGWMKNAFIADYLAQALTEKGYTNGALSSYDGFSRNLYDGEESMLFNLYDRGVLAGTMAYSGPMSIVQLRSYPLNSQDGRRFYTFSDGSIRSAYLDPADGLCRTALEDLTAYSQALDCAQTALVLAPVFIADKADEAGLSALEAEGVYTVLSGGGELRFCDPALTVTAGEGYTAMYEGS